MTSEIELGNPTELGYPKSWLGSYPQVKEHFEAGGGTAAHLAAFELERFFQLTKTTDQPLAMTSPKIDMLWHNFIEFTEDYGRFCEENFGSFIHHRPRTSATPVPDIAVRNFYEHYTKNFGDVPEIWKIGVPPEVIAYGEGRNSNLPSSYKWSGWPGR